MSDAITELCGKTYIKGKLKEILLEFISETNPNVEECIKKVNSVLIKDFVALAKTTSSEYFNELVKGIEK